MTRTALAFPVCVLFLSVSIPAAGQSLIAWEANNGYSPPDSNSIQSMCTINTNMRNVRFGLKYIF